MSLHQAGFDSAVASLGTSLTPEQARLISRYTNQVIIAYDSDGAGVKAAQRGITILEQLDVKVRVLRMEGAKDPDEFIKNRGADAFRNLIDGSEDQVEYRLRTVSDKYDLTKDDQKVSFLREATELVAKLPGLAERQVYAMRVASLAGVKDEIVSQEVERRRERILSGARKTEAREAAQPERQSRTPVKGVRYDDPASALAEEGLIRLLYLEPSLINTPGLPEGSDFSSPALSNIYGQVCSRLRDGGTVSAASLGGVLNGEEMSLLVSILQKPENLSRSTESLRDYIARIRDAGMRRDGSGGATDLKALQEQLKKTKSYGSRS